VQITANPEEVQPMSVNKVWEQIYSQEETHMVLIVVSHKKWNWPHIVDDMFVGIYNNDTVYVTDLSLNILPIEILHNLKYYTGHRYGSGPYMSFKGVPKLLRQFDKDWYDKMEHRFGPSSWQLKCQIIDGVLCFEHPYTNDVLKL
jgi:nitrogenase molybdenum-iron protein alpha/beta subunit